MGVDHRYIASRHAGAWAVTREGARKGSSNHPTELDAWSEARRRARGAGGDAILHGREGEVKTVNSYRIVKR